MQLAPIDISVDRHALPLQQLPVRQMRVLVFTDHFLKFCTPQCTKVDGAKLRNLGYKCTSRVQALLGHLSTGRLQFPAARRQKFRNSKEALLHLHQQMQPTNFKCATLPNSKIRGNWLAVPRLISRNAAYFQQHQHFYCPQPNCYHDPKHVPKQIGHGAILKLHPKLFLLHNLHSQQQGQQQGPKLNLFAIFATQKLCSPCYLVLLVHSGRADFISAFIAAVLLPQRQPCECTERNAQFGLKSPYKIRISWTMQCHWAGCPPCFAQYGH